MFGERIKELRLSLKLNQVEFGKTLNVTKQCVCNWENGNIQPSADMLIRIATKYSVSVDFLLGLSQNRGIDVSGLTNEQISHIQMLINDLQQNNNGEKS
ncbi:MAG: helix-turn-helix transcriptional regulator [Oscillospiraceae bacterium]|nr:helix-turn-helix transcriptional regulator [Oscillospiraceae bacterium]